MLKPITLLVTIFLSSLNAQDGFYGVKSHEIFLQKQAEAIQVVQRGCEEQIPLGDLIDSLGKIRYEVADQVKTTNAEDFLKNRASEKALGESTPLNSKPYRWLRQQIRDKVGALKEGVGIWHETSLGRYRLRILPTDQWPEQSKLTPKINAEMSRLNSISQICDWSSDLSAGFEIYYFPGFMNRGSFDVPDDVDISKPLNLFCFMDLTFLKLLARSPDVKVFILETQQKLNEVYFPSSWFFGVLSQFNVDPQASIQKSCIHLAHSPRCVVDMHMEQVKVLWDVLLSGEHETIEEFAKRLAKFNYFWSLAMPRVRGSAALGEWLSEGISNYFGYTLTLDKEICSNVDQAVFANLDFDDFSRMYIDAIGITLKQPEQN